MVSMWQVLSNLVVLRYTSVALLCLVVYEFLITLEAVTTFIWPSRLSLPKVLFLVNRYLAIITVVIEVYMLVLDKDKDNCRTLFMAGSVLSSSCVVFAEATLLVRLYAIWDRRRDILALCLITFAGAIAGIYYATVQFIVPASPLPRFVFQSGCAISIPNHAQWISLTIIACFETLALILLLARGFLHYEKTLSMCVLMKIMLTDGTVYYVCILCTTIANILVLRLDTTSLAVVLLVPQSVMHSILCNRLLLRIRDFGSYASVRPRASVYHHA